MSVPFALVRDVRNHPVHSASQVGPGAQMSVEFADGRIAATADADRPASAAAKPAGGEPKPATARRVTKPVGQGSLF